VRIACFLVAFASVLGCGRTRLALPAPTPDAEPVDAGRSDAGPFVEIDSGLPGVDAGPIATGDLFRALSCDLDADQILAAAARWVACHPESRVTMQTVIEAWEGFVLGHPNAPASTFTGLPAGCDVWRCAAEATACGQLDECIDSARPGVGGCGPTQCFGSELATCDAEGLWVTAVDCADFGATCVEDHCEIAGCSFGGFAPMEVTCDGADVSLCEGLLNIDCASTYPDEMTACASFFISGELPVSWCAPGGESQAGAYETEVVCSGARSRVRIDSVSSRRYVYFCRDNGYSDCDERGCVL